MKKLNRKEVNELKGIYSECFKRVLSAKMIDINQLSENDGAECLKDLAKNQEILDYIGRILEENQGKMVFSPDTLLIVGANLLGILLILNYEKLDIVSSKALSFILKVKV